MKTRRLVAIPIVILTLLSGLLSVDAWGKKKNPKKITVKEQCENPAPAICAIPAEFQTIINCSDSIECFLADAWVGTDSYCKKYGEPIGQLLVSRVTNDSTVMTKIKSLLLDPVLIQSDSVVKESTFMPDFGFIFSCETDTVAVSYSEYCDLVRFQNRAGYHDFNGEGIRNELILIAKNIYPNDKYIRTISRRL